MARLGPVDAGAADGGIEDGLANPGDAAGFVEIGPEIAAGRDGEQEIVDLDGLEIVEAEAVGRGRDEGAIGRDGRRRCGGS